MLKYLRHIELKYILIMFIMIMIYFYSLICGHFGLDEALIFEYEKNGQNRICYVSRGVTIQDEKI